MAGKTKSVNTDVIIVGGGFSGIGLAALLDKAGITSVVIDRDDPAATLKSTFDGRTTAISHASRNMLVEAGIWPQADAAACPIHTIRIADGDDAFGMDFDCRVVGAPFGWIIDNSLLRRALYQRAHDAPHIHHWAPATPQTITHNDTHIAMTLNTGQTLRAPLLVGADGRGSFVRQWANIGLKKRDYYHDALVCIVQHENPHHHLALEHFLPTGPLAVLPMTNSKTHQPQSCVVWTVPRQTADHYFTLPPATLALELTRRLPDYYGAVRVPGKFFRYPLTVQHAASYYAPRTALIADAAHGIHPIAGQGLNLGFRDVQVLARLITDYHGLGLDIGSTTLLRCYQQKRVADSLSMLAGTDALDRLFTNNNAAARLARRIGLRLVDNIPPIKTFFMRHAMGLTPMTRVG